MSNLDYGRNLLNRAEYLREILYEEQAPKEEGITGEELKTGGEQTILRIRQKRLAREQLEQVQAQLIEYIGAL